MYCKNCGNLIEEDSKFCKFCGQEQNKKNETQNIVEENNSSKGRSNILITIFAFLLCLAPVLFCISASNIDSCDIGSTQILEQDITSSDYDAITQEGLSSVTIIVSPYTNIKTCTVSLTIYDSNDKVIYADTITKTSLVKGNSYSYEFDYNLTSALTASYYKYKITGKK